MPANFLKSSSNDLKIFLSKTGSMLVEIFLILYLLPALILKVSSIPSLSLMNTLLDKIIREIQDKIKK